MAIATLVLGIVSCVFAFVPFASILALAAGIVAIVLAVKVNKGLKEQGIKDNKVTAGMVTGVIGTSLAGLWTILWFSVFSVAGCAACGAYNYLY